jgi:uncharacterized protein (TIGR00106 family)
MLAFFSISPLGESESVSGAVSEIVALIAGSGLEYKLTAMGTIIEGEPDAVFDLLKACHAQMRVSHNRVTSKIMIDDRVGQTGRINGKIKSIESKLGRELKK